jgi:hypothetical protein
MRHILFIDCKIENVQILGLMVLIVRFGYAADHWFDC